MKNFYFSFDEDDIKYKKVAIHLKAMINNHELIHGEKLPTIREYSKLLGVNTSTIINAYELLQNEGYAYKKMGSGTYVKKEEQKNYILKEYSNTYKKLTRGNLENFIDFTGETTSSEFFPVDTFKKVLNEVLDRDKEDAFIYQDALGYKGLRKSINKHFWNNKMEIDDILVVSGAQQGIDIITKAIINVNDNVVIEKPSYSGAMNVFKWRKANIIEIDMKKDGIQVEELEKILQKNRIKCFYTMPYFQNPTGVTYSFEKKKRILELAEIYDFYIIEDDYLSDISYDNRVEFKSLKSMDTKDRVIYIKSFSKIFLPGIRIGYVIPPQKYSDKIQTFKINTDITTSSLMQRALDIYIRKGLWKQHIKNLNLEYKKRYEFLIKECNNLLKDKVQIYDTYGGLSLFLKIQRKDVNCIKLFEYCKDNNVLITPGMLYYLNSDDGMQYFKIGFSKVDTKAIHQGLMVINNLLKESE
ncbi:PLP-dependent aminotransferase family protein [Clostridium grantii]|uniref:Transcriptional regulator, GntR family n=1 Tax=Clostridium grantii DSM 8605 TaxID=1121316 RepID=A0A1M5SKS0_9CLOT|nr:PLP-dependent aminotransferase family protein [Clostridium grantii]SHH39101.1 transcriptional regulator, GntR family [Clostridium grantii DSM 8605]